jgi:hypothetical protein
MDLKCSWYAAPASAARSAPKASSVFVADGIEVVVGVVEGAARASSSSRSISTKFYMQCSTPLARRSR